MPWLPGYESSAPVRVGNAASIQFQLDVYGELIDALCARAQRRARAATPTRGASSVAILKFLEKNWNKPDHGIWEMRGEKRHFTHSKVMAWVAFDRAIRDVEKYGLRGPVARWRKLRARIHADICRNGFDRDAQHVRPVLRRAPKSTRACC